MTKKQKQVKERVPGAGRAKMLVAAMLGGLLLNPPLLEISSVDPMARLFGWPLILFYINAIWILLIIMVLMPKIGLWVKMAAATVKRLLGRGSA
ncbi:hypothetical protein [Sedimenticola selenatireducens]|jgi:hypothetical protein|uniref:Uncharacterized protein n=1 Tax=Sedimenticola selenatireducens TaxID=191960 RepID=A0A558DU83_9GAMM|nr:hypothetical protein [Sedimenticola selenatireducens]TVO77000.1 hypothetical protein FHP88_06145 [Sedimenticola selenatireducens]TVT64443.1 MAG: hypothetical protein FHK78_09390 [Sedimenticola selenatireducens]